MSVFPTKSRFRRRQGRCYELAYKTFADMPASATLVHGTIVNGGVLLAHAWLEHEDNAYDAVLHVTMPVGLYGAKHGAVAERRYTHGEAVLLACRYERYGPWRETAGLWRDPGDASIPSPYDPPSAALAPHE